ncbi:MAG: F0F1 ATP synthase subunit delta [Prevotellaceae bacterium]|jgi:F-type H+-transporting ATPase subunit delta|nr:F0F1 ATP synthase subunit delta [Prevotellaceae bacterium]
MNEGLISSRYAKTLLLFARKQQAEDVVYQQALQIAKICEQDRRLKKILADPILSKNDKIRIIGTVLNGNMSPVLKIFVDTVLENERENYLQRICLRYIDLYRKQHNIHHARLTTAEVVDYAIIEKQIVDLINSVTGGSVEIQHEIDPDIIGGFMIDVDSMRIDATLATQLKRTKDGFDEKNKLIINN